MGHPVFATREPGSGPVCAMATPGPRRHVFLRLAPLQCASGAETVEQMDLPPETDPEQRLLRLIAKVPGLQKLGQVLARNKHPPPALRDALSELENGISDVSADQVRSIIQQELGPRLDRYAAKIEPAIFSEASVSAVMRFTWHNPVTKRRERGVFKVLKAIHPRLLCRGYGASCATGKAAGSQTQAVRLCPHVLPDTFNGVRRLLQHEVDFTLEQATLLKEACLYSHVPGVRVPRLIQPLPKSQQLRKSMARRSQTQCCACRPGVGHTSANNW